MLSRSLILGAAWTLAAVCAIALPAYAQQLPNSGQEPGSPVCGEFFDKWDVPGVSPMMLAVGGLGRELMAANDCLEKGNAPTACLHWGKVLEVTDKLGPPFNQDRVGIEKLMSEHKCGAPPAPARAPGAGTIPGAGSVPGIGSVPVR